VTGFWQGRRVFVTGATGMSGSWVVKELLARGARVVALVRTSRPQSELYRSGDAGRVTVVPGDVEDLGALERALADSGADTVFHLAAQAVVGIAHRDPLPTFETNVRGTWNLLEACRRRADAVRRVVMVSSDKAYGTQPELPYTEDMPVAGTHPYEVSKSAADLMAQAYHHTYGLRVGIARGGNIFGGGDLNWSRIVPGTIRAFLRGERPAVRSASTYVRDYFYVKDAARAYIRLGECLDDDQVAGEAFNFSNESPLNVLELVGVIQKLMDAGHLAPDVLNVAEGEIRSQYLSAAKARKRLGWAPEFDLEAGLRETIAWYRDFLARGVA
jgi:CDP-glucose 4,6-dehydratase